MTRNRIADVEDCCHEREAVGNNGTEFGTKAASVCCDIDRPGLSLMAEVSRMRIPMKVDYGVRALVDLAQFAQDHPVRTAEIARREFIPEPYLDQVLTTLNKYGFIMSRRGPKGGHMLARSSSNISLGEVMSTLEGRSAPLDCIDEPAECTLSSACAQRELWRDVEISIHRLLDTTTLADLVDRQKVLSSQRS